MKKPMCETCPYWDNDKEIYLENEGVCRRKSPSRTNSNPITLDIEWCGEHPSFNEWIESQKENYSSSKDIRIDKPEYRGKLK